ncbi:hypothetical protein EBU91_04920 [bacterium]|nr:hypothetical protein [bacterium]
MAKRPIFAALIKLDDDLELYKTFLYLYCTKKKLAGEISIIPREQLLVLLSLYMKYGFSEETKLKAEKILGIDKRATLNSFNHDLTAQGFLVPHLIKKSNKDLKESLKEIKEYIESNKAEFLLFNFCFKLEIGE